MAFRHPTSQKLLAAAQDIPPPPYGRDPAIYASLFDVEDPEEEEDEHLSCIQLRIDTPLTVKGENNLIAVDAASSSTKIAASVVGALKLMGMGELGVSMIDGNGHPRPIKLEIRAETVIEGSKNVVGEKAVLAVVASNGAVKRKAEMGVGLKSKRAMSEPLEGGGKRSRNN